jgi:23S rRNA (uracil1939-C5)-methyltransferase
LADATLRLDVERLTYGFDALAHRDRQVVFVPYAAPGDRVRAEVIERRRGYLRAQVLAVEEAGAARVMPGCRWFPLCGGCQWQHVAPTVQRDAKAAIVAEQLARGAGLRDAAVAPTLASPGDWRYRARITLVVEGRRAGYHRARSHTLVEVDECPLAVPAVAAHLAPARAWTASLRVALRRVTVAEAPGGVVLVGAAAAAPGPADLAASESLLAQVATVRGIVLTGGGMRRTLGDPTVRVLLEPGLDLEVPADAFTQVNPEGNRRLVEVVLRLGAFAAGERALDLYCGAGNFTLPIARRHAVVDGIERDPIAVEAGRANARRAGLSAASFQAGRVTDALRARVPGTLDAVVLDPPRAGAADAVAAIARLRAPRVVYVSCEPSTLARDVRAFLACGYRLGRVQPIDLFPQTYHIETVAELLLT